MVLKRTISYFLAQEGHMYQSKIGISSHSGGFNAGAMKYSRSGIEKTLISDRSLSVIPAIAFRQ